MTNINRAAGKTGSQEQTGSQDRRTHSLLLIEDDEDARDGMQSLLELHGFRVLAAENGQQGLRLLEEQGSVCLILLDWMMPIMNGAQFLARLHAHPALAWTPVLVVSAMAGEHLSIPVPYLQKPIAPHDLIREVSKHCGQRKNSSGLE